MIMVSYLIRSMRAASLKHSEERGMDCIEEALDR